MQSTNEYVIKSRTSLQFSTSTLLIFSFVGGLALGAAVVYALAFYLPLVSSVS